jgi:hypothetical protein
MRQLVSITSLTAFLLHVLLGCCAHHTHAERPGDGALPSVAVGHRACQHSHASHPAPKEAPHAPGERCQEGDCVFAACSKVELAKDSLLAATAFDVLRHAADLLPAPAARPRSDSHAAWKPPLRSHLLLGVLLI